MKIYNIANIARNSLLIICILLVAPGAKADPGHGHHRRTTTPTPTATQTAATPTPIPTPVPSPSATATPAGTAFYVAPTGSDSDSGLSRTSPWRTIQHAANSLQPGQTAIVTTGIYAERVVVSRSGSSGAPITLQADSNATVVTEGFQIQADHVSIVGFEITNQAASDPAGFGVYVVGSDNQISSNYIHDLYFEGIMVSGNGDANSSATARNIVSNNLIVRAEMAGIHLEGQGNTASGNDISQTRQYPSGGPRRDGADADGFRFFGSGHTIRSNRIHDIDYGTAENPDPHVDCFQTWGPATNITIERNLCVWASTSESTDNEVSSLESLDGPSGQITYKNNVFANMRQGINADSTPGLSVLNNTWNNILEEAVILSSSPEATVENNIFFNVGSGGDSYACVDNTSASGTTFVTNDHYMSSGSPGTYCSNAPFTSQNPQFINVEMLDFHLQSSSPLINTGTTVGIVADDYDGTSRPQGSGYDFGAFEFH